MNTFKKLFKKKVKTLLPENASPETLKQQTIKINPDFAFISELEKCLLKGCQLSHLSFIDAEELQSMGESVKELMIIIQSLKVQQMENNQLRNFYENNKHIVANHTSIIKSIQASHEERMLVIRDEYIKLLQDKDNQIQKLNQQAKIIHAKAQNLEQELNITKDKNIQLNKQILGAILQKEKHQQKILILEKEIQMYQSVQNNSVIKLSNYSPKQILPIVLQSSISQIILSSLTVSEILQMSLLNKLSHHIISNSISLNRLLIKKAFSQTEKWRSDAIKEIRYFQSMVQNINDDSIKQSALKYIYFHQKPGEYILSSFKQINPEDQKQKDRQEAKKRKNSGSFFSNFLAPKDKKDDTKISIKQLSDPQSFKKIQSKIQEYFHSTPTLNMNKGNPLKLFRQTMLEQYQDMKNVIMNQNQILKLYHSAKFLYLESQELHRFSQFLFSFLVQLSKKHQEMKCQFEDIIEKQQSVKNALQIISAQKNRIQQQNWLLQYDLTKQKVVLQDMSKKVQSQNKQVSELRQNNEKLKVQTGQFLKKNQDLTKRVVKLQKYLQSIRSLMTV